MKFYKIIISAGHVGAGKDIPLCLYIEAKTIIDAVDAAKKFPAVKKGGKFARTYNAYEITKEEYIEGRKISAYDRAYNFYKI